MTLRTIATAAVVTLLGTLALADAEAQTNKGADARQANDAGCFAAINYGSGVNTFNLCISDTGRLTQITAPAGVSHIYGSSGHYYLCDARTGTYSANGGADFYTFSINQPNGPNTLPLTIVTRTFDNLWQVTHQFSRYAQVLELQIAQTLQNLGGPVSGVHFARYMDTAIDNGDSGDIGDRSLDSVTVRDRPGDDSTTNHMVTMTAMTRTTPHSTAVNSYLATVGCNPASAATPVGPADLGVNLTYTLGNFTANQKKSVKFRFVRN